MFYCVVRIPPVTLPLQQAEMSAMEKQERQGGLQQHQRLTAALKKQIEHFTSVQSTLFKLLWTHRTVAGCRGSTQRIRRKERRRTAKLGEKRGRGGGRGRLWPGFKFELVQQSS